MGSALGALVSRLALVSAQPAAVSVVDDRGVRCGRRAAETGRHHDAVADRIGVRVRRLRSPGRHGPVLEPAGAGAGAAQARRPRRRERRADRRAPPRRRPAVPSRCGSPSGWRCSASRSSSSRPAATRTCSGCSPGSRSCFGRQCDAALSQQIETQTVARRRAAPSGVPAAFASTSKSTAHPLRPVNRHSSARPCSGLACATSFPRDLGPVPQAQSRIRGPGRSALHHGGRGHGQGDADRPGWAGIDALRRHGVCPLSAEDGDVMTRPGPRMALGAEVVARCLRELHAGTLP